MSQLLTSQLARQKTGIGFERETMVGVLPKIKFPYFFGYKDDIKFTDDGIAFDGDLEHNFQINGKERLEIRDTAIKFKMGAAETTEMTLDATDLTLNGVNLVLTGTNEINHASTLIIDPTTATQFNVNGNKRLEIKLNTFTLTTASTTAGLTIEIEQTTAPSAGDLIVAFQNRTAEQRKAIYFGSVANDLRESIVHASGANGAFTIDHQGTGNFNIQNTDAAAMILSTTNVARLTIASGGGITFGTGASLTMNANNITQTTGIITSNGANVSSISFPVAELFLNGSDTAVVLTTAAISSWGGASLYLEDNDATNGIIRLTAGGLKIMSTGTYLLTINGNRTDTSTDTILIRTDTNDNLVTAPSTVFTFPSRSAADIVSFSALLVVSSAPYRVFVAASGATAAMTGGSTYALAGARFTVQKVSGLQAQT